MSKDILIPNEENPLIWINAERMSGAACFYGTRLPVNSLFENLEDGIRIDEWLDAFPSVAREQAIAVWNMLAIECWNQLREGSLGHLRAEATPPKAADHDVKTAQEMGWDRFRNGDLIQMAEGAFDVLITSDQKLKDQQNLTGRNLAIIILTTNHLRVVFGLAPN